MSQGHPIQKERALSPKCLLTYHDHLVILSQGMPQAPPSLYLSPPHSRRPRPLMEPPLPSPVVLLKSFH